MVRVLRQVSLRTVMIAIGFVALASQAFMGEQGILSWMDYSREVARLEAVSAELAAERATLQARVDALDLAGADADYVEERAYALLGYAGPSDLVIIDAP
jgi:cell division protein FtsB